MFYKNSEDFSLYWKIIRDAQVENRNLSAANRQRVLIGWRELKWKRHEAVDASKKTRRELVGGWRRRGKNSQLKTSHDDIKTA